jgi:superfamily II DNA or RNA helicase
MSDIILRDYQLRAIQWLCQQRRGMLVSPAASGKTVIVAAALQSVVNSKPRTNSVKVGWTCNTREQKEQAEKALAQFPCNIFAKVECAQSETDWSDRDVLIVDECHHAHVHAPSWFGPVVSFNGALWGMTATPELEDVEKRNSLNRLFGDNRFTVTREDVAHAIAPAIVRLLDPLAPSGLGDFISKEIERLIKQRKPWWKGPEHELYMVTSWGVCIEKGIVGNQPRNETVIATAHRHANDRMLVLVNQVEHGQSLAALIPNSAMCNSKMGAKKRRAALDSFRAGELRCLVATSLADEGLDLPMADVLILVSGGRSRAKTEQRTGRVLRNFAGKTGAIIYDFLDSFHPLMAKHAKARVKLYRELGYRYEGELL